MSDESKATPEVNQSGGINLAGQGDVTIGQDVVGRDKIVTTNIGLNVQELVEALRQVFPSGDARPERVGQVLDQFRAYHAKLYEWKELHNAINKIIDAFDQYSGRVESSYTEKKPLKPTVYQEAWRPVNRGVDDMLDWAQTIQHIGKRYQALANDRLEGERWAVDIKARRDDLMTHFQRGQAVEQSMSGAVFQRLFQADSAQEWLRRLYILTHEFEDVIKRYMSQADSQLRQTATDLYDLSKQAFGS
jgi:hypothetical protein